MPCHFYFLLSTESSTTWQANASRISNIRMLVLEGSRQGLSTHSQWHWNSCCPLHLSSFQEQSCFWPQATLVITDLSLLLIFQRDSPEKKHLWWAALCSSQTSTRSSLLLLSTASLTSEEPKYFLTHPLQRPLEMSTLLLNKHNSASCFLLEIGSVLTGSDLLVGGGEWGVKTAFDPLFHSLTS